MAACVAMAGCPPGGKGKITPLGSTVTVAAPATPTPTPGAEKALPQQLPGGWRLSGGPADYGPATITDALGDEAGRFRGIKSYASAEYTDLQKRVIAVEVFVLSSPDAAAGALEIGRPKDPKTKAITGDDVDEAFQSGLRAEARRGAIVVRARWFEEDDETLEDAAIDAMRDVLEIAGTALTPLPASAPPASHD